MPKATTSQNDGLDDLPGFDRIDPEDLPEVDELPDEPESPPANAAPSTTSYSPPPPASEPESNRTRSPSTTGSTDDVDEPDEDPELADGLTFLAGGLFELVGQTINRFARARRHNQPTPLWLVSEEEAERFAEPVARIAERHLPDELRTGDARDIVIAGSVAMEYASHNLAGFPGVDPAVHALPVAVAPPPPPPPPPPEGAQVQPASPPMSRAEPSAAAEAPPLVSPEI